MITIAGGIILAAFWLWVGWALLVPLILGLAVALEYVEKWLDKTVGRR